MDLLPALEHAVRELELAGRRVLVAVSGGVDSVVLLHGLHALAPAHGLALRVAHVDHGLRGEESEADVAFVAGLASTLAVPFASRRIEPRAELSGRSNRERPTLQEAARALRYAALEEIAGALGADLIATAHNRDDQAETVLMRLLRGTGPDGLGGIPERSPDGRIVRPLLSVSRRQIESYAREHALHWREDSSNRSDHYTRNRLRHHWLDQLAREFNPQLLRAIHNLAEAQRRDTEWLEGIVEQESRARLRMTDHGVELVRQGWKELPVALGRRLVRRALRSLGGGRDVSRVHLARMLAFLADEAGGGGATLELPGGLRLTRTRDSYWLRRVEESE